MYNYFVIVDSGLNGTGSNTTITDAKNVKFNQSMGSTTDTFSFDLPNSHNQYTGVIKPFDLITIYSNINTDTLQSSNIVYTGLVKQLTGYKDDNTKLTISGVSFTQITTNALVFGAMANGVATNIMDYIQICINSVKTRDSIYNITWDVNNPTTKSNGSAFPTFYGFRDFDRPLSFILEKYLTNDYTGDGSYYWYISTDKKLVIRKRLNTPVNTWTAGRDFKVANYNINADDVKNFIVVKCGNDPAGRSVTTRWDDPVSRSYYGFKYYLLTDQNICSAMIEAERKKYPSLYSSTSNYPSSYSGYVTAWNESVSSQSDYLSKFRIEAKKRGAQEGHDFQVLHNRGFITVKITRPPEVGYAVGAIVNITDPSFVYYNSSTNQTVPLLNYPLRITDISYDKNNVLYTLKEDLAMSSK